MRVVVALGGNALLRRGEEPTPPSSSANVATRREALGPLASEHELVVTHGNGPQVGLLALQRRRPDSTPYPLDILGAQTQGMIGYVIARARERAAGPPGRGQVITQVSSTADDPAFAEPTKFVGPVYEEARAARAGGRARLDREGGRRRVAARRPLARAARVVETGAIAAWSKPATSWSARAAAACRSSATTRGQLRASRRSSTRTSPRRCSPRRSKPTCS